MPETNEDQNPIQAIWTKLSDETGVSFEMIGHIHLSITIKRKKNIQVSSKSASFFIIQDLINNDNGSVKDILENNGVESSNDFGDIVRRLCEEGVLVEEENDNYNDFKGLFTSETVDDFIKDHKIKKDRDWYKIIYNLLFILGAFSILFYHLSDGSTILRWSAGVFILLGWLLSQFRNKIEPIISRLLDR